MQSGAVMRISANEFNRRIAAGELVQDAKGKWVEVDAQGKVKAASKYRNRITEVDGRQFDSAAEAKYYQQLKQRLALGEIAAFECQVRYPIADAILNDDGTVYASKVDYIADFVITHLDESIEVVDVKGMILDLYKLKRSIMWHRHRIRITEIANQNKRGKTKNKGRKHGN